MTQEKLEQRVIEFWDKNFPICCGYPKCDGDLEGIPHERECPMYGVEPEISMRQKIALFAKSELQKAAEIALEQDESDCTECRGCGTVIAAKIRKLMD